MATSTKCCSIITFFSHENFLCFENLAVTFGTTYTFWESKYLGHDTIFQIFRYTAHNFLKHYNWVIFSRRVYTSPIIDVLLVFFTEPDVLTDLIAWMIVPTPFLAYFLSFLLHLLHLRHFRLVLLVRGLSVVCEFRWKLKFLCFYWTENLAQSVVYGLEKSKPRMVKPTSPVRLLKEFFKGGEALGVSNVFGNSI